MTYRELTVESGGHQRIEVRLPPVVRRPVRFPGVPEPMTWFEVSCFDGAGRRVLRYYSSRDSKVPQVVTRAIVPGAYELVVKDGRGRERRSRFTISTDSRNDDEMVDVRLPE